MTRGYSLSYRMYMEGILTPFHSANIICTPNGVEASINIFANRAVYDLKPKTAIQIFYKDWVPNKNYDLGWRLMFDGFFSSYYKMDQSTEGRMVTIVCRDFRMDIRRAPAAIAYASDNDLGARQLYNMNGLFQTYVVKGINDPKKTSGKQDKKDQTPTTSTTPKETPTYANSDNFQGAASANSQTAVTPSSTSEVQNVPSRGGVGQSTASLPTSSLLRAPDAAENISHKGVDIREYGGQLNPLSDMLRYIAGTAYGDTTKQKNGDYHYTSSYGNVFHDDERGRAKCGFFLDALVRGMWMEAVGGTSVGQFINKRCRVDKRFLIPSNRAGYNIWSRQSAGLEVGSYILGNAQFTSVEAAIMRVAGLFATRVYSCSTPTLIPIGNDETGNPNPSVKMVMDEQVRSFLINRASAEFGGKYILNESMLLPPLEFTAPPNCNIFLPPVYDKVTWQYDIDYDMTRGYYKQVDSLSAPGAGATLATLGVQVPNGLFDVYSEESKKDKFNRHKPPLTLEERYKGINVSYGSVEYNLAADSAAIGQIEATFCTKTANKIKTQIANLRSKKNKVNGKSKVPTTPTNVPDEEKKILDKAFDDKQNDIQRRRVSATDDELHGLSHESVITSMKRHALLKFLNTKFAGRIVNVDMMFNPYVMCGFPGMVVDDEEAAGCQSSKSIIGMVQQVKHIIYISPDGAEASTSVVMNNARFADEPTDIDDGGNLLYMSPTDPIKAKINSSTLWYSDPSYRIPEAKAGTKSKLNDKFYDLQKMDGIDPYIYAKDILSLTLKDLSHKESNTIYIDEEYEPQKIARFYRDVLQHNEDSFMIGNANGEKFVYDSIHEAVVELRKNRKELLYDYTAAMRFISRNVCSADAFFQGILGLSVLRNGEYICKESDFNDTIIDDEYYGVTTQLFNSSSIDGLKEKVVRTTRKTTVSATYGGKKILNTGTIAEESLGDGLLTGPGDFSSILETMPITALIKERRMVVKNYIEEAGKMAHGMTFSLPTIKG